MHADKDHYVASLTINLVVPVLEDLQEMRLSAVFHVSIL